MTDMIYLSRKPLQPVGRKTADWEKVIVNKQVQNINHVSI